MPERAPALFIGHGSPMNAIEDTPSSRGWAEIATRFPRPRAVVVISAHWVTEGVRVTANARPRTIHDFGGFPRELFEQQYPAPGDPALAERIVRLLAPFGAQADESWGLDHGAWSVLKHLYPDADVPVLQVSLDIRRGPQEHYEIGRALAALRDDNVLILGSGNIVHNLPAFFRTQTPAPWVAGFDEHIVSSAARNDHASILSYTAAPDAALAAPDWEHFFPVFYTLAAQREDEQAHVFNRHLAPGISMSSIAYGLPA